MGVPGDAMLGVVVELLRQRLDLGVLEQLPARLMRASDKWCERAVASEDGGMAATAAPCENATGDTPRQRGRRRFERPSAWGNEPTGVTDHREGLWLSVWPAGLRHGTAVGDRAPPRRGLNDTAPGQRTRGGDAMRAGRLPVLCRRSRRLRRSGRRQPMGMGCQSSWHNGANPVPRSPRQHSPPPTHSHTHTRASHPAESIELARQTVIP